MAQAKAKCAVYLGPVYGYRFEGEEFPYDGPPHKYLELLDAPKEPSRKSKSEDKDS